MSASKIQRTVLISEPHIFGNTARYGGHQYARVFAHYGWRVILLSATFNATRLFVPGFKTKSGVKQEYYDLWAEKGRQIEPNITNYCLAHLLPTKLRYERPFSYAAPYLYLPSVESILKAHAIDAVDLLWLNGNQDWLLDKAVPHRKMLMRIIDDYSGFSNGYDNYHPLMKATAARADGVFACSEQVRDVFSRLVQGIQIAPNGVDFEHFAQPVYSEPSEIQAIPHPRVTYVGAIAEWFDLDLVVELAHRLPQHHFIIFGGWTREQPATDTLPVNIHILGPVKYDVVPHVLAHSDIGLVPFKDTKLVRGVSPIKVYEYLAASLPVVTLSWRELERESLPVFLAHSVDEFESGIRAATGLSASERESLRDFVKGCSWEKRCRECLRQSGFHWNEIEGVKVTAFMTYNHDNVLPRIIWVAAHPPIPPFSGSTSKTLCGLDALSSMTQIELVTFVDELSEDRISDTLLGYWGERDITPYFLNKRQAQKSAAALLQRRFQSSTTFDSGLLARQLKELDWYSKDCLVVFDDIALAHLVPIYGRNTIMSPHDCMSQMFYSHYQVERSLSLKAKKYIQYRLARYYEQNFYHSALLVHVIAQRDRVWLESINPQARYHVVPNADLLNPGLTRDADSLWDILIWGDLTIPACVKGTASFLEHCKDNPHLASARKILVGKVSKVQATRFLGENIMLTVEYSARLEDETGRLRAAKVMVVPDIGGAGIKNRVVNIISSGLCLACLLPQMEGVERIADRGAINAVSMLELVERIEVALDNGRYVDIARTGQALYQEYYDLQSNRRLWGEMIERAIQIRETKNPRLAVHD